MQLSEANRTIIFRFTITLVRNSLCWTRRLYTTSPRRWQQPGAPTLCLAVLLCPPFGLFALAATIVASLWYSDTPSYDTSSVELNAEALSIQKSHYQKSKLTPTAHRRRLLSFATNMALYAIVYGMLTYMAAAVVLSFKFWKGELGYSINDEIESNYYRLPRAITPFSYDIFLQPQLEPPFIFNGTVQIQFKTEYDVSEIMLNSLELIIQSVLVDEVTTKFVADDKRERLTIFSSKPLKSDRLHVLRIDYIGTLNNHMVGFYRVKYDLPNGQERYGATTQFEATEARRAFPCWDEPDFKATFALTLVAPANRTTISNMPIKNEIIDRSNSEMKIVSFTRSPIMSTYLVAFVIGEYDYIEGFDSNLVKVGVYMPLGKSYEGNFALQVITKILPLYKDYFGISYPLPKCDSIAITEMVDDAMENMGLVTYREDNLEIDDNSDAVDNQETASLVCHEIAHQWFGNLVTMDWWTNLWLNEGFANWIQYYCVEMLFPGFEIWNQFPGKEILPSLALDSLGNSHPVEVPVQDPRKIGEMFDKIAYNKGASIIRMLENFIGDEVFRKGLNYYITQYQYKNAKTQDLWLALEQFSEVKVAEIMNKWTKQIGYPLISVENSQQVGSSLVLRLSQRRFLADGSGDHSSTWSVPVCVGTQRGPLTCSLMTSVEHSLVLPNVGPNDWISLNFEGTGFYRVNYPNEFLSRFISAIQNKSLPPPDRLIVINDLFAMARAGLKETVTALKMCEVYVDDEEEVVWRVILEQLNHVNALLEEREDPHDETTSVALKRFARFQQRLLARLYSRLGWEEWRNETHKQKLLRPRVIEQLGLSGQTDVVQHALRLFTEHVRTADAIPPSLETAVYRIVLRWGNTSTFNQLLKLFKQTDNSDIILTLGSANSADILQMALSFLISNDVDAQTIPEGISRFSGSRVSRDIAWKFVQVNWDRLATLLSGGNQLALMIEGLMTEFARMQISEELEQFFRAHSARTAERAVRRAAENIRVNSKQAERDWNAVVAYLNKLFPG